MDRTERFYMIDQMLCNARFVTREQFIQALEVSLATFKRDLEYMRDRLSAPIVWDRQQGGYCYDQTDAETGHFQLPGLWFNTSEIQALLTMNALLENIQPGILSSHINPLRSRIRLLLDESDHSVGEIEKRIRIIPAAAKSFSSDNFQVISQALLNRSRLLITYHSRQQGRESRREISPQRLIHYRDNWYLDAWCHLRCGLRSFSIDAIKCLEISPDKAQEVDPDELARELESGYGIFSGSDTKVAVLCFSPKIARWVSSERWHPEQKSHFDNCGNYFLEISYSNDTELIMDILRYGGEVEVIEPPALRRNVIEKIDEMKKIYQLT